MLKYAILGPVELRRRSGRCSVGGPRQVALLADLLVHANEAVSTDRLVEDIWGPERSDGSTKRVQMAVARLRRTLEEALTLPSAGGLPLQSTAGGYRLEVAPGELDADVFERRVREAAEALGRGDYAGARHTLRAALAMWRGPALADVTYADFARAAIERLDELRLDAEETLVEADLALGDHADAIGRLSALVAEHPLRERPAAQLMVALHRSGRQQEALDAFQRIRAALGEIGLEPGARLVALQRRILEQDRTLVPAPQELPLALRSVPQCIGRDDERAELRRALDATASGMRNIVCLSGEPGIGKTLLAAHAALEAHGDGFIVAWGAALESLRPPYGPWLAPLERLAGRAPPAVLEANGAVLARFVAAEESVLRPTPSDRQGDRYGLFRAVLNLLEGVAASAPVLVCLDDLHWADEDSVALLHYVAEVTDQDLPLAIVATFREAELPGRLAELDRFPNVVRLRLEGLHAGDVAAMITARSRRAAFGGGRRLAEEIARETSGNPFFVGELLQHLDDAAAGSRAVDSLAELRLPGALLAVVQRRVRRLGEHAERVLRAAAVIGQEFELEVLESLVDGDPLDALEHAERAGLVSCERPGRYVFSHALVVHALDESMDPTRRARTHRQIAEALEARPDRDPRALARHWRCTGDPAHGRRAAGYAREAGERALEHFAPDEASRAFAESLELLLRHGGTAEEQCDALIELGEAKRVAGDVTFKCNLVKAARIAGRQGDHSRLTRAVLANTIGPFGAAGRGDRLRVRTLERARELVPADWAEGPLMTAVLAKELYFGGDPARGSQLSVTAIAQARRHGDRARLARVMAIVAVISPLAPLAAHEQIVAELMRLADELGDPELAFRAANAAFLLGMHSGDPVPLAAGLQRMCALDDVLRQPILHWTRLWAQSAERTLRGDLAGGEKLTTEAELDALQHRRPQARLITFGQLLAIRLEQDALDDLRPRLDELIAASSKLPVLRLARGFIDAETGNRDGAVAVLQRAAADGFQFPFDRTIAFSLARCADIAVRVGDRHVASELYERLLLFRDQFATTAGVSSRGSVELSLGRVATLLGDLDRARDHLERADRAHVRLRAPLLRARSTLAMADALLAAGSRARATELLDETRVLARRYGSAALEREVSARTRQALQLR